MINERKCRESLPRILAPGSEFRRNGQRRPFDRRVVRTLQPSSPASQKL